ncbi:MAG: hypothetical protein RRC07_06360 [Anaerolineae bacterium]|nr:hypothetical protein [Anaerolineae bacterium]
MDALARLQDYFRSLFQFDLADLDFGLYRLFHLERAEIEAFISKQLPREVEAAFAAVVGQETEQTRQRYEHCRKDLLESLGDDALLSDGRVAPEKREMALQLRATRQAVIDYEAAREQYQAIEITEGHKAEVFNHLVAFFSRYYEEGDFIPKRRYGMREAYAVPYQGEEVFFHWANRDQHYVKTAERFQDYAFTVEDLTGKYRVRFTMAAASVPKDNTKGNTRFFFPRPDLATYEAGGQGFILPFEYRLPTPEEAAQYGSNSRAQESILEEARPRILEAAPDENLRALLSRPTDEGEGAPAVLLKRLRHFCRRNTSDYFIHRDLRGFLARELAFYVKDQVVHLLDLEADLDAKRRVVRTFRSLAEKVIEFLAAIEEAQKTLFEKRKFVLVADYLIPIQHVPRRFWSEIVGTKDRPGNKEQLAEWERWGLLNPRTDLFNPSGAANEAFLERHPTLPLHTRHFDRDFVRLLMARENVAAYGQAERFDALQADLETLPPLAVDAFFFDPARRDEAGRRIYSVAGYRPPLSLLERWLPHVPRGAAKISPGVDYAELPAETEVEFVSLDGEVREAVLWYGDLRGDARRRATLLPSGATLTDRDLPPEPIAVTGPQEYLFEPDGAVIRAHLVEVVADRLGATKLDDDIAYLTAPRPGTTPFARCFKLEAALPFQLKRLRHWLRANDVGQVTVKKRGSPLDPQELQRQLRLEGSRHVILFLTQVRGDPHVLAGEECGVDFE